MLKHTPFIEAFEALVLPKGAPPEFARWSALWALSAAIERRVWTFTKGERLFPNLFVMLLAPPGFGKGLVLEPTRRIVSRLGKNYIGADSVTTASLVDDLRAGQRSIIDPKSQRTEDYYAFNMLSPELQVMLPEHDVKMLGKLTNLYDGKEYSETRRGGKGENSFHLERVIISMLAGTTPEQLFTTFPESAFKTGFFSRTMLIWGDMGESGDLFSAGEDDAVQQREHSLTAALKSITKTTGQFYFTPEAKNKTNKFYRENYPYGGNPVPSHPRLLYYCTRRTQHLVKLMMLYALSAGAPELILDEYHFDLAYHTLISAEGRMPEIFQEQAQGGEANIVQDIHHQMTTMYVKSGGKPIPKSKLIQLFGARVQAFKINALIDMAVNGGWIKRVTHEKFGTCYTPNSMTPSDTERTMKQ